MGLFDIFKNKINKVDRIDDETCWTSEEQVEIVREDGYVVYKIDRVNYLEKQIVGFSGRKKYSNNRKFCVVFMDGLGKNDKGYIALVDIKSNKIVYTIRVNRPKKCVVSDTGLVACNDWVNWDEKATSVFWVFNQKGEVLLRIDYRQNLGDTCEVNNSGTLAITDVCKGWEYHVIDIEQRKIIKKIKKDYTTYRHIDIEKREIILKYSDQEEKLVKF